MTVGRPRQHLRETSSIRTRNAEARHCCVLLCKDADDGHKAARKRAFAAVAEEEAGVAGGAEGAYVNIFGENAGSQKLGAIGFAKIEMDVLRGRLVAGRLHVEPLERIGFFAGTGLVEIVGGIGELRGEFGDEVSGDFVAAWADRGAD